MSKRLTRKHFEDLCESRNHVLTEFENYTGVKSILSFKCNICDHEWSSTAHSYQCSKTGCWGCKKERIRSVQTGSKRSSDVGRRISLKAKGRPAWNKGIKGSVPGGGSREASWRPTREQRILPGTLYLIRYIDPDGTHYKIGITRKGIHGRFSPDQIETVVRLWELPLGKCFDIEQATLRWAKAQGWRYRSSTTTELLREESIPLILNYIENQT